MGLLELVGRLSRRAGGWWVGVEWVGGLAGGCEWVVSGRGMDGWVGGIC